MPKTTDYSPAMREISLHLDSETHFRAKKLQKKKKNDKFHLRTHPMLNAFGDVP
jgi:hypothetical protein